jgi:hypothetical protein
MHKVLLYLITVKGREATKSLCVSILRPQILATNEAIQVLKPKFLNVRGDGGWFVLCHFQTSWSGTQANSSKSVGNDGDISENKYKDMCKDRDLLQVTSVTFTPLFFAPILLFVWWTQFAAAYIPSLSNPYNKYMMTFMYQSIGTFILFRVRGVAGSVCSSTIWSDTGMLVVLIIVALMDWMVAW